MALACAAFGFALSGTEAQQQTGPAPAAADLATRRADLQKLEGDRALSEEQRRKIEADIEEIRTDRVRLSAALIETTDKIRTAENRTAELEARLDTLKGSEHEIRSSLERRRSTIADVLAALQRLGREPLPAILVKPGDMTSAVRTAMLLGAVVPELRGEVESLASDLAELQRVEAAIAADRSTLSQEAATLSAEQARLPGLIAARQEAQSRAEAALDIEQRHAADLARQTTNLKDLIARLEAESGPARRAADAANDADETLRRGGGSSTPGSDPFQNTSRLAPAIAFADTKGLLHLPVAGSILKAFGSDDGFGSTQRGVSIATRQRAPVSAPSDGWVSFAGPYRSYGQLLIINAGGGYYIVLAGMDRANVTLGQFVLAGEPVGEMGDGSVKTAAAIALGAAQPVLYVEFRKDGAAVDPGPWWAKADSEKVRG